MGKILKRYSVAIIILLVEAGLEMSPYQNMPLAITLWSAAGLWSVVATVLWVKQKKSKVLSNRFYLHLVGMTCPQQ